MKACEAIQEDLPGYAGGRLSSTERAPIEAHLRGCGACQEELASLERLERFLSSGLPLIETSPTLRSRFASRLAAEVEAEEAAEAKRGGFLGWLTRPWLVPAVVSAAVAVIVLVQSLGEPPAPTARVASTPEKARPVVVAERPSASNGAVHVAKRESEAPVQVAQADEPKEPERGVPEEVENDPELFVDFAVIRELDSLESIEGTQESAG